MITPNHDGLSSVATKERASPMKFEVIVEKTERGKFVATAVEYPGVSATGRTEQEALARVKRALELHLKQQTAERTLGECT